MKLRLWHTFAIALVAFAATAMTGCSRAVLVPTESYDVIEPQPGQSYDVKTVDGRRYSTTNLTRTDSTLIIDGGAEHHGVRKRRDVKRADRVTLQLREVTSLRRTEPRLARHGVALALGDRVRVYSADGAPTIGYVEAIDADAVAVAGDGSGTAQTIELQSIQRMERWESDRGHGVAGALIGGAVGTLAGMAWAFSDWEWFSGKDPDDSRVLVGATLGATAGYLIGANDRSTEWRRVDLRRLGVNVKQTHSGTRAGVFWDF